MDETRRTFCANACRAASIAAAGTALGVVFDACSGSPTSGVNAQNLPSIGASFNGGVTLVIDASSPLAATGGLAIVVTAAVDFLVARTSATTFSAVSAACTHAACTVSTFTGQTYVCPCHGSEFDVNGRVVAGPAVNPLTTFKTSFVGNVLTIT
jgi:nitrite reductase/ring-hydroxylating ferredoxin subunit